MIETNNSSQDYFLMFKNSVIASIFVVLIHMARNHFITNDVGLSFCVLLLLLLLLLFLFVLFVCLLFFLVKKIIIIIIIN